MPPGSKQQVQPKAPKPVQSDTVQASSMKELAIDDLDMVLHAIHQDQFNPAVLGRMSVEDKLESLTTI